MQASGYKQKMVYSKTGCRCAICGEWYDLICTCFIPEWTRVADGSYDNLIPLCPECFIKTRYRFIELGSLRYLPEVYIQQLMRYYSEMSDYLRKYVRLYGSYRTGGKLDVDRACLVLSSYDAYIEENKDKLNWEAK